MSRADALSRKQEIIDAFRGDPSKNDPRLDRDPSNPADKAAIQDDVADLLEQLMLLRPYMGKEDAKAYQGWLQNLEDNIEIPADAVPFLEKQLERILKTKQEVENGADFDPYK